MGRFREFRNRMIRRAGLAPEAAGASRTVLIDNRSVYLENHKGVKEYTKTRVNIDLGDKNIIIDGRELKLEGFGKNNASVSGTIKAISFENNTNERRALR